MDAAPPSTASPVPTDICRTPPYPSPAETRRILLLATGERLQFVFPPKTDTAAWASLSHDIQQACKDVVEDPLAARALDTLHIALVSTLSAAGLQKGGNDADHQERRPPPLTDRIREAKSCLNKAKKDAKKGVSNGAVKANDAILTSLVQASEEDQTARLTKRNHKLAAAKPKKLADAIWGRSMSSDPPECSPADCELFFRDVFQATETSSAAPSWLPPQQPPLPIKPLVITADTVRNALQRKAGSKSAPGIDGITYIALGCLPWLPELLAKLFNKLVEQQTAPQMWRYGLTVLLHKGGKRDLSNYRPITLTPTISKLFHSIVAAWLEPALTSTGVIPTTIQKGFINGVAGAVEHDLVLDETLMEAKQAKKKLFMVLVDLKNAFGSVPHGRITWALERFGAPQWVQKYVANLYGDMKTKMTCKSWATEYLQVSRGVLQGDTLSPLLFLLVMQVGLNGLTASCPGHGYTSGRDQQPPQFLKCFADDLTVITQDVPKLQSALHKFEDITAWLGMEMKPSKCRAFGLSNGKYRKVNIQINNQTILNIEDAPSKFLGMQLSLNQTPKEKAEIASAAVTEVLAALDTFPLPPADKVKIYKDFAIPKLRWILLVQDILPTAMNRISRKAEALVKKWWRMPRAASRDALRLATGIPSLEDVAGQVQVGKYATAQASRDPAVQQVWRARAKRGHKPAKRLLQQFGPTLPPSRKTMMSETKATQTAELRAKVHQLLVQGAWDALPKTLEDDKRWRCLIWGLPPSMTEFAAKAAVDLLPTKSNLHRWKVASDAVCRRCGDAKDTLAHTLNHCAPLLGAYTWRHNSVLQHLHNFLQEHRPPQQKVLADLPGLTYVLPLPTPLRPDLALVSPNSVQFVELTIAFESNTTKSHARKASKYHGLPALAATEGLKATVHCIEMGSRGLPSKGWNAWAAAFRIPQQTTKECARVALQASQIIWMHRDTTWPDPPLLCTRV